jgi:hypothetical protein
MIPMIFDEDLHCKVPKECLILGVTSLAEAGVRAALEGPGD